MGGRLIHGIDLYTGKYGTFKSLDFSKIWSLLKHNGFPSQLFFACARVTLILPSRQVDLYQREECWSCHWYLGIFCSWNGCVDKVVADFSIVHVS